MSYHFSSQYFTGRGPVHYPVHTEQDPSMHWAMQLHNELQRRGKLRSLSWDDNVAGPPHKPIWTAIVYIDEVEYGRARSRRKQDARDQAAKQALKALEQELFGAQESGKYHDYDPDDRMPA